MTVGFAAFAIVSGLGWLIDVATTIGLVQAGVVPFWASAAGAAVAVTFVYIVSRLLVFEVRRLGGAVDCAIYVIWQAFAIAMASFAVAMIGSALEPATAYWRSADMPEALALAAGIGKVLVTPVTLAVNYLFLRWLTQRGPNAASTRRA